MPRSRLQHLQPLFLADFEALGHAVDFGVDLLVGDLDLAILAVVHDQPLVDEAFEHFVAVPFAAGGGECVAADILAVDDGHHVVLRASRLAAARRSFAGPRCLRRRLGLLLVAGCAFAERVRDLRVGGLVADRELQRDAQADDR